MRGVRAVSKAIGIFTKIKKQLDNAIQICLKEIENKDNEASKLRADITDLSYEKERALKVLKALEELTSI